MINRGPNQTNTCKPSQYHLREVWLCHQRRPQMQRQTGAGPGHGAPRRHRCPRPGVEQQPNPVWGGDDVKVGDEPIALPGTSRDDRPAERRAFPPFAVADRDLEGRRPELQEPTAVHRIDDHCGSVGQGRILG
jgi:hypothetical protein